MHTDQVSVLIAGAGPTGLTLAIELARRGVSHRVVDTAPGPRPGSRGKGLQPRTLELLDDLGILDRVLAHGRVGMPIRSTAPGGTVTLAGGPVTTRSDDIPHPDGVITPQWRVEETLRARLAELGGAVEFGATLTHVDQDDDGVRATVTTASDTDVVTAQWLVGCDGGHSTVRRQVGIAFAGRTAEDIRMIVADVAVDGLDPDAWQMWRHPDGMFALCPLPSTDLWQLQAAVAPDLEPVLDRSGLQSTIELRTGRTDVTLREVRWSSLWRANVRLVDRYRQGRVLLAGDAAHIHSPAGGQGMNTGIQDAHNLAWKLAAVVTGTASPDLLDTYDDERRPVAAAVLALSDDRLRRTLEEHGIPIERTRDTTQLSIGYRRSVLSRDDRADGSDSAGGAAVLRAGDRAPDASGLLTSNGERRLFDITRGGQFTLLCFGRPTPNSQLPPDTQVVDVVPDHPAAGQVVDTRGRLGHAYAATADTLVLIRPDGYIAAISDHGDLPKVLPAVLPNRHPPATAPDPARTTRPQRG